MKINLIIFFLLLRRVESICSYINKNNCVKEEMNTLNFIGDDKIICNSSYICPSAIFCSKSKLYKTWYCGTTNMNKYKQVMRIEFKRCRYGIIKNSERIYIEDKKNEFPVLIVLAIILFILNTLFHNKESKKLSKLNNIFKCIIRRPSIFDWMLLTIILNIIGENRYYNTLVRSN
jgi:hypothetical protein